ncbi:hypothetical protein Tco_0320959 [Tanacetum coccineum]
MSNYLRNQGTWKLSQLKKLKFEEIKEEFDKLVQQIDTFIDDKDVPAIGEQIAEAKEEEQVNKNRKKKRSKRLERPEDAYDRVLWSDLKTMFDPPLIEDAIWSFYHFNKMLLEMNEVCYKLLKMIEKQAGIRK